MKYLFRGKRISDGRWVHGSLIETPEGMVITGHEGDEAFYHAVVPETVGISTGKRGFHEERIFTGDIVLTRYWSGTLAIGDIVFNEKTSSFRLRFKDYGNSIGESNTSKLSKFEELQVIGNIFDTPDLLEIRTGR